jgi:hypothetical protein
MEADILFKDHDEGADFCFMPNDWANSSYIGNEGMLGQSDWEKGGLSAGSQLSRAKMDSVPAAESYCHFEGQKSFEACSRALIMGRICIEFFSWKRLACVGRTKKNPMSRGSSFHKLRQVRRGGGAFISDKSMGSLCIWSPS